MTAEGIDPFALTVARESPYWVEDVPIGGWKATLKGLVERVVAGLLLIICAPTLLLCAALIRFESPGPVLIRQARVGLYGRPFTLLKFRTTYDPAIDPNIAETLSYLYADKMFFLRERRDFGLTRMGATLRNLALDELPQLLNVLAGDMALVGPRPRFAEELDLEEEDDLRLLLVRPGLTGMAQIQFSPEAGAGEVRTFDRYYIDYWSFGLDAWILLKTLVAVIGPGRHYRIEST